MVELLEVTVDGLEVVVAAACAGARKHEVYVLRPRRRPRRDAGARSRRCSCCGRRAAWIGGSSGRGITGIRAGRGVGGAGGRRDVGVRREPARLVGVLGGLTLRLKGDTRPYLRESVSFAEGGGFFGRHGSRSVDSRPSRRAVRRTQASSPNGRLRRTHDRSRSKLFLGHPGIDLLDPSGRPGE